MRRFGRIKVCGLAVVVTVLSSIPKLERLTPMRLQPKRVPKYD
jgi:hypothetical protein